METTMREISRATHSSSFLKPENTASKIDTDRIGVADVIGFTFCYFLFVFCWTWLFLSITVALEPPFTIDLDIFGVTLHIPGFLRLVIYLQTSQGLMVSAVCIFLAACCWQLHQKGGIEG
jgi:hypothetical protein